MNDTELEKILRNPPRVKAPRDLSEKLEAKIVLPAEPREAAVDNRFFLKRWIPALSFGALFLGCLVAIGMQSNVLLDLRRQNVQLRAGTQNLEQLRQENAELQRLRAQSQQLEQLRRDNAELERLRGEIAQLREQSAEVATLRAENERLSAQQKAMAAAAPGAQEEDPFAVQKEKALSVQCISNLKQVGLGARMWANDHNDVMPPDYITMRNELNTPKILVCPADQARTRARTWEEFGPANVSYEFLAPNFPEGPPLTTIMTRCPIHGHVGMIDGSVQSGQWKSATQKDGRWVLERRN
jgi:hypothetical protein